MSRHRVNEVMFRALQDVSVFSYEVVRRVSAYITGGIVVAAVAVYEHLHGRSIAPFPFLCGVGVFLIVAFYRTWQDEHHRAEDLERDLTKNSGLIEYDGVLWSSLRIPHTTNTWAAGGPFCLHDKTLLQAVRMGSRRIPKDSDVLGVDISHLYCPQCAAEFRLGAPDAGHMRTVGNSRRGALDVILASKGEAAIGMVEAQLLQDMKLGRLPLDWFQQPNAKG